MSKWFYFVKVAAAQYGREILYKIRHLTQISSKKVSKIQNSDLKIV